MKYLMGVLMALVVQSANAGKTEQFAADGTTAQTVQQRLAGSVDGTNLVITDYSKSWNAYNPMSLLVDSQRKYRTISFEFIDNLGSKQKFTCPASIKDSEKSIFIYKCTGGERAFRFYHKLNRYGYDADSITVEDVVLKNSTVQKSGRNGAVQ